MFCFLGCCDRSCWVMLSSTHPFADGVALAYLVEPLVGSGPAWGAAFSLPHGSLACLASWWGAGRCFHDCGPDFAVGG